MIAAFPSQSVWPFEAIEIYVFLIFWVSYAVRPANIKSPMTEIAKVIADEAIQMFRIEATIRPITPIIKKLPQPEISRFVVYPYNERFKMFPGIYKLRNIPNIPDGNHSFELDYSIIHIGAKLKALKSNSNEWFPSGMFGIFLNL